MDEQGIFLETAHPVKFLEVVQKALGKPIDYASKIESLMQQSSLFTSMSTDNNEFKEILLSG